MKEKEVGRIKDFQSGDVSCTRCGKTLTLYYNGGELDEKHCCGLTYRTETQGIDLVIYEDDSK